jgi:protein KTI12
MVRWDSPLFTVLWEDEDIPRDGIWEAISKGAVKPAHGSVQMVSNLVAYVGQCIDRFNQIAKAPSDALQVLEQTTTAMVSAVLAEASNQGGSGGATSIAIAGQKLQLNLPARNLTLSELQRLKRQFVTVHKKAITLGSTEKGRVEWGEEQIAQKFSLYLEEHLN